MAKLNFRQGIVRYPSVSEGGPFLTVAVNRVDITAAVNTVPVQVTFGHLDQNYLHQESTPTSSAWGSGPHSIVGPISPNKNLPFTTLANYHLYWDIDFLTGIISYDYTKVTPTFGPTPPVTPVQDQHWYDTVNFVMKVRVGSIWIEKLRVFAADYNGAGTGGLTIRTTGTQVGLTGTAAYAGYLLFDDDNKPIQRFRKDRKGVFVHTEMPLASQWNSGGGVANFRLETMIFAAKAVEPISQFAAVTFTNPGKLSLARNAVPSFPAVGIAAEDMQTGEIRQYIPSGFVENIAWNWPVFSTTPPGTPLFVGQTGQLITTPPQVSSIQQIGYIVDAVTIYVQPQQIIIYG